MLQGAASRLSTAVRALRHRNYRLFFSGQLVSLVGTWMQMVAQSWLVYRLTGSSVLLGSIGFCSQFPVFLLAPVGGVAADRCNRHRMIVSTQAASMVLAFVLALLTLLGRVQVWHVFVLAALLGVVNAFDMPVRQAFVVEIVGREDMLNAIALNSSAFNGARIVGPALAGILVAHLGEGWCFFANAVSYIAVIIGLLMMKAPPSTRQSENRSVVKDVLQGFDFARRTPPIRALLLLLALVSLTAMPYSVLMPIFADRILHGGARALGLLMGITGVGALTGSLTLAFRSRLTGLGRWVAAACGGFGLSLILFSTSRHLWLSAALLLPLGFCMMVQMASSNTLIQSMAPDHLRGRVMAVHSMMFMGMAPVGAFLAGLLAQTLGAPGTLCLGGLLAMGGACIFAARLPRLRIDSA
jgi:MFS family permease